MNVSSTNIFIFFENFDDIWIPEFPNYEPFNPHNLHRLADSIKNNSFDQDLIIKKFMRHLFNFY